MPETLRRLSEGEMQEKYPALTDITKKVGATVLKHFKPFRRDASLVIPPLLLISADEYQHNVRVVTRNSSRTNRTHLNTPMGLEPYSGTVHASVDEIQYYLASEDRRRDLYGVLAEEYIHALTTFREGSGLRVGFSALPGSKVPHGLKPGGIYEYEPEKLPEDSPSTRENPTDIQLTEHATELAVNLMYNYLYPDLAGHNIIMFSDFDSGKESVVGPLDGLPLIRVLDSLVTGRKKTLQNINPRMYEFFEQPTSHMFLYNPRSSSEDRLFSYTHRPSDKLSIMSSIGG